MKLKKRVRISLNGEKNIYFVYIEFRNIVKCLIYIEYVNGVSDEMTTTHTVCCSDICFNFERLYWSKAIDSFIRFFSFFKPTRKNIVSVIFIKIYKYFLGDFHINFSLKGITYSTNIDWILVFILLSTKIKGNC